MRQIILALVIALIPASAYAETTVPTSKSSDGTLVNKTTSSSGTSVTSNTIVLPPHKVGDCVSLLGGKWQQLADGTWAEPKDRVNTCNNGGNTGFNFGMIPGGSALSGIAALLNLNNSSNNLGNMSSNQWFINCVLTQSFMPRPECQGLNGILNNSGLLNNVGSSGILGSLANAALYTQLGVNSNSNAFFANIDGYGVAVSVPKKNETLTKVLSVLSLGWNLSHLF